MQKGVSGRGGRGAEYMSMGMYMIEFVKVTVLVWLRLEGQC